MSQAPRLHIADQSQRNGWYVVQAESHSICETTVYHSCTEQYCVSVWGKIPAIKFEQEFFWDNAPERINPNDNKRCFNMIKKVAFNAILKITDLVDVI
jgi:UDP-N-acetyl-D-mannosaminuronate dehydrogenase